MKIHAKVVLALALLVSGVALAKHVGRFYCGSSCQLGAGLASGDTYTFIHTTINESVDDWIDSDGNPNTVVICNGVMCSLYTYVALSGQFMAEGYYYSTWTGDSDTGGGGGSVGGGGGWGIPTVTVGDPQPEDDEDKD